MKAEIDQVGPPHLAHPEHRFSGVSDTAGDQVEPYPEQALLQVGYIGGIQVPGSCFSVAGDGLILKKCHGNKE